MPILPSRVVSEYRVLLRFAAIGILATIAHMTAALWLLALSETSVMAANMTAFLVAFAVSFVGNYFWTFRARGRFRQSLMRYLFVAGGAFLANSLVLAGLLTVEHFDARVAIVLSAAVVPICTYVLSRLWAFKSHANLSDSK